VPGEFAEGNTGTVFVSSGKGLTPCELVGFGLLPVGAVPLGDDGACEGAGFDGACAPRRIGVTQQHHANTCTARMTRFVLFCGFCSCRSIAPSMLGCEA
jgi:hypothetical protein